MLKIRLAILVLIGILAGSAQAEKKPKGDKPDKAGKAESKAPALDELRSIIQPMFEALDPTAEQKRTAQGVMTDDAWKAALKVFERERGGEILRFTHKTVSAVIPTIMMPKMMAYNMQKTMKERMAKKAGPPTPEEIAAIRKATQERVRAKLGPSIMDNVRELAAERVKELLLDKKVLVRVLAENVSKATLTEEQTEKFDKALTDAGYPAELVNGPDPILEQRVHKMLETLADEVLADLKEAGGAAKTGKKEEPTASSLRSAESSGKACRVLADKRVEEPLRTIAGEYAFRTGSKISLQFLPVAKVDALVQDKKLQCDAVLDIGKKKGSTSPVGELPGAARVAWKYPTGEPVWAAVLTDHSNAAEFIRFVGGPTGHRLWSESKAGFTIVTGKTHAEAFEWVAENRVKHTYPMTAMRMLREIGGIREGTCIDIGCGPGNLDIELAKRAKFKIIGLDIDADMKPFFEKKVREAGFQGRLSFVVGDAQALPFEDDFADVIVSRGTLTFIPDIGKCLREVDRVLKPTGVAFLGGRYIYTPQADKISNEKLKKIVEECGVPGARMIDQRGQWVKIVGPEAPKEAQAIQGGPHMLVNRFIADYAITEGKALLVCGSDSEQQQEMQQGFLESTDLEITALYPTEEVAAEAERRIKEAKLTDRITCRAGTLVDLPFEEGSFDLVAGVGPILIWDHREKKMQETYRVLRTGGAALVGGKYVYMPDFRKVSSETLRQAAANTGISSIRVSDDMGQWVEIRKGIKDRGLRD